MQRERLGRDHRADAAEQAAERAELQQHMLVENAVAQAGPGLVEDVPADHEHRRERDRCHHERQQRHITVVATMTPISTKMTMLNTAPTPKALRALRSSASSSAKRTSLSVSRTE